MTTTATERKRDYNRAYYQENRERIRRQQAEYARVHRQDIAEREKANREVNHEEIILKGREWWTKNGDRSNTRRRAARAANPGLQKSNHEWKKAWRLANPEQAAVIGKVHSDRRRARKKALFVEDVCAELVIERDQWRCHLCLGEILERDSWEVDHVIPLWHGGPHCYDNVAAAHLFCNRSKGNKIRSADALILFESLASWCLFHAPTAALRYLHSVDERARAVADSMM